MQRHLRHLISNLRSRNPTVALEALRTWSQNARFRDAVSLVRAAPETDRPMLANAIRDALCGYPHTLYAAPVLLHLRSESLHWLELPSPDSVREPEGTKWRWQEVQRQLSPWVMDEEPGIVAGKIEVALLIARSSDEEPPVIHDDWLGTLFRHIPASDTLHLSARMVLPWPDAVETAMVLRAAALTPDEHAEDPCAFLSDHGRSWAQEAGRSFRHFADA